MPPALVAAGAIAAPIIGGAIGREAGRGDREAAERERNAAVAAIQSLQIPDIEKQKLLLELPQLVGEINPEMEQYFQQDPSAMEGIQISPEFQEAQMAALRSLQDMGSEGITASEKAVLNQIRRSTAGEEQARQGAIMQNMAERGVGGSGLELAARLSSSQKAADRASEESDRLAAMAQQRALESISKAGSLAGQVRGQEFGEKSDTARAKDAINQFNTANRQSLESRNVNAEREAQVRNLQEKQRIADQQAALRNQEQQYNKNLVDKRFDQEFQKATGVATGKNNLASHLDKSASEAGQMWSQIGTGVSKGITSGFGGK